MQTEILPPVNPLERSSIYSDELIRSICNTIREGATLSAATKLHGISHETLYAWMRASAEVSELVTRARADIRARVEIKFTADALTSEDWRARHAYLQANPDTRAEWGPVLNLATVPIERLSELVAGSDTGQDQSWPMLQGSVTDNSAQQQHEQGSAEPAREGRE